MSDEPKSRVKSPTAEAGKKRLMADIGGRHSKVSAGDCGTARAGDFGMALAGMRGVAQAGTQGIALAGINGEADAGKSGLAIVDDGGSAIAGEGGVIAFRYFSAAQKRYRLLVGYVGENGILPNTRYREHNGEIVSAADLEGGRPYMVKNRK